MDELFREIEEYLEGSRSKSGKFVRLGTSDRYAVFVVGKCLIVEDKHLQVNVCMPLLSGDAIDIGE